MNFFNKLADNFRNNFKYIIVSFLIAITAWFFISVQIFPTVEDRIRNVSVEIQPTDYMMQNDLQIVNEYESLVDIRIEGKRYDITGLSADDFYATLDLSSVRSAGTFTVPVSVSGKTGNECTILDTEPVAVTLQIDKIETREFPVTAVAPSISLPEGFYIDEMTASPATITITGSATELDKIARVEARSRYSGLISESHDTQGEIILYGTNGSRIANDDLKLSTSDVTVNIPVFKQKTLPIRFEFTNVPSNFDIDSLKYIIRPSSITVAAPDNSIDHLSELVIETIDLSELTLTKTVSIPISLPEGYKNLSGNNTARIEFQTADYGKLDYTVTNISIINPPDNYDISLLTQELVVTVIGPSGMLSDLSASDIAITANLLGVTLREGTQDVPVTLLIRGREQQCWVSGTYKVTINAEPKTE